MRLRVIVLVYVALFAAELSWSGVTPLIPSYIEQYGLSDFLGGLVLSVASLGILVISIPASMLTRTISPRTMTLTSMAVISASGFAMWLASGYWWIVGARLVFGLGFGILYVSMTTWLDDAAGEHSPRVLALTTSIVGVAATVAPALTGTIAHAHGLAAPFVWLGAITALLLLLLMFDRSGTGLRKDPAPPLRDLTRSVTGDPGLSNMLLLTAAAATLWMTADLLVPLRLDDEGLDVAAIGLTFSLSSVIFVAASALTARRADRWARPRLAGWWTVALAACTALPALLPGLAVTLVFLVGASVTTGVIIALTFPFGLQAVARGAVTVAVMSAMANIVWALTGMAGPTVGGAFAEWAGDQVAFGVLAAVSAVVAVIVLRSSRTVRSGQP